MSSKSLYVGNLPYGASENDLMDLFAQYGTVESVKIVMDKETGRSKGFGFIEMGSDAEASQAISNLNGYSMSGRNIKVNESRPKKR
ncbi:MAG: RNA-binding protein [Oligoflexia bacterium]|nr:RNA-binding protein [Oligoflexia bacterium]